MADPRLARIQAVVFDVGETIGGSLEFSPDYYHLLFVRHVCGEEYTFSDEEILGACETADLELFSHRLAEQNLSVNYRITNADWLFRNRAVLRRLGVIDGIEEKAQEYQDLWGNLLASRKPRIRPEARKVLQELHDRGYKLGIATNWSDPREWMDSEFLALIESVQYTMVGGYTKPSPYMLILNAYELGINPLRCAFVGNSVKVDVAAARRAGMVPILYTEDSSDIEGAAEDVIIIRDLRELLSLLS